MKQDSNAILTLCSHVCVGDGVRPLEPKEYSQLAQKLSHSGRSPKDIFSFSTDDFKSILGISGDEIERITRLLDRNASLSFALEEYQNIGIDAITRADALYPKKLKKKLGNSCPPIFYCAGNLQLLDRKYMGYVGARTVQADDIDFTKAAVRKTVSLGYGVVSGGAKGIDTVSGEEALLKGSFVIEYLSDSLLKKLKKSDMVRYIQNGSLLMMSVSKPDAAFHVGMAMMRNRYIYAQSSATVVVRSDLNKGGTWAGACENLQKNWCPTLCWEHPYPGNQALIAKGAIPITENWDGTIPEPKPNFAVTESYEQMSIFDMSNPV